MKILKTHPMFGAAGLFLASALGSAIAQTTPPQTTPATAASADVASPGSMNPDNSGTYATGKPLENTDHEGFWGHMNPFARKKWVHRQIDPIKDRTNELDQLQAKNANDIRDVDARATSGVHRAMNVAQTADQHAADAANRADQANSLAVAADGKTNSLNSTVSNLDQYQKVSATSLNFLRGRTTLTPREKANLDEVASSLANQKGYIVEVQGYSRAGVATSQAMADSVVRYLVTAHQVPMYRIYRTGLGRTTETASAGNDKPLTNGVRVTILHNSLASMEGVPSGGATTSSNPMTGVSNPSSSFN
jgi:outer membrane protein OmpA-like peptidoglycan-associated protein